MKGTAINNHNHASRVAAMTKNESGFNSGGSGNNSRAAILLVLVSCMTAMVVSMTFIAGQDLSKSSNSVIFIEAANEYFREGNARYQDKDYPSAVAAYQEAIRIYPEYGFAWANLALTLQAGGGGQGKGGLEHFSGDASLAAYEQAISLMPHRARNHYNLGKSLMALSAWDEAITWFRLALSHSPRFPAALFRLALCLQQTAGGTKQALETYQRVLRVDSSFTAASVNYCYLLLVQQNEPGAEACYEDVLRAKPRNVEALVQLAQLAHRRHHLDRASDLFARVLGMDYYNSAALFSQAVLQGRPVSRSLLHKHQTDHYGAVAFHYDTTMRQHDYDVPRQLLTASLRLLEGGGGVARCLLSLHNNTKETTAHTHSDGSSFSDRDYHRYSDDDLTSVYDLECLLALREAVGTGGDEDKVVLDLGCGTGLLCEEYRTLSGSTPLSLRFHGVDISEPMASRARARDCYHRVTTSEAEDFLAAASTMASSPPSSWPPSPLREDEGADEGTDGYDVILAAELLKHLGGSTGGSGLESLLSRVQAGRLLRPGGLLAFSLDVLHTTGDGSGGTSDEHGASVPFSPLTTDSTDTVAASASSPAEREDGGGSTSKPNSPRKSRSKSKGRVKERDSDGDHDAAPPVLLHPLTASFVYSLPAVLRLLEMQRLHGLQLLEMRPVNTPSSQASASYHAASSVSGSSSGIGASGMENGDIGSVSGRRMPAIRSFIFVLQQLEHEGQAAVP